MPGNKASSALIVSSYSHACSARTFMHVHYTAFEYAVGGPNSEWRVNPSVSEELNKCIGPWDGLLSEDCNRYTGLVIGTSLLLLHSKNYLYND